MNKIINYIIELIDKDVECMSYKDAIIIALLISVPTLILGQIIF